MEEEDISIAADIAAAWQCVSNLHQIGSAIRALKCHLVCQRQIRATTSDASRTDQSPRHAQYVPPPLEGQASCRRAAPLHLSPASARQHFHKAEGLASCQAYDGKDSHELCHSPPSPSGVGLQPGTEAAVAGTGATFAEGDSGRYDFSPASSASTSLGMGTPPKAPSPPHGHLDMNMTQIAIESTSSQLMLHKEGATSQARHMHTGVWNHSTPAGKPQRPRQTSTSSASPGQHDHTVSSTGPAPASTVLPTASAAHSAWFISHPTTSSNRSAAHGAVECSATAPQSSSSSGKVPAWDTLPVKQPGSSATSAQGAMMSSQHLDMNASHTGAMSLPPPLGPHAQESSSASQDNHAARGTQRPCAPARLATAQQPQVSDMAKTQQQEVDRCALPAVELADNQCTDVAHASTVQQKQQSPAVSTMVDGFRIQLPQQRTVQGNATPPFASEHCSMTGTSAAAATASSKSSSCATRHGSECDFWRASDSTSQLAAVSGFFGPSNQGQQQARRGAAQMGFYTQPVGAEKLYEAIAGVNALEQGGSSSSGSCCSSGTSESGWETMGEAGDADDDAGLQDDAGSVNTHKTQQHLARLQQQLFQQQQHWWQLSQEQEERGTMGIVNQRSESAGSNSGSGMQEQQAPYFQRDGGLQQQQPAHAWQTVGQQQHFGKYQPVAAPISLTDTQLPHSNGLVKLLRPQPPPPPQQQQQQQQQQQASMGPRNTAQQQQQPFMESTYGSQRGAPWHTDRHAAASTASSEHATAAATAAATAHDSTVLRLFPAAPATSRLRMHLSSLAQTSSGTTTSQAQPSAHPGCNGIDSSVQAEAGTGSHGGHDGKSEVNSRSQDEAARQAATSSVAAPRSHAEARVAAAAWAAGSGRKADRVLVQPPAPTHMPVPPLGHTMAPQMVANKHQGLQAADTIPACMPVTPSARSATHVSETNVTGVSAHGSTNDIAARSAMGPLDSDQMFKAIKQQLAKLQQHFSTSAEMHTGADGLPERACLD